MMVKGHFCNCNHDKDLSDYDESDKGFSGDDGGGGDGIVIVNGDNNSSLYLEP